MDNLILMTDSYKASHAWQYPAGTKGMFSYLESRGGVYDRTLFFGLQYLIQRYLTKPVTHADVDEAKAFFAAHGTPFPEAGWRRVVDIHRGMLPIRIRAVAEGMVVPVSNALLTVESLDPELFWLVTWVETFLMRLWYPITVATQSWHVRRTIRDALLRTGGIEGLDFKLHDFGARGVSSGESAAIGGAAHLAAGWQGSDTVEGVWMAKHFYGCDMPAYSIPASEHSTITSWGPDREYQAFDNMLAQFGGQGKILACVSDSYDIFKAVDYWISQSAAIKASGSTLVIRPDSGDPCDILLAILYRFEDAEMLQINAKGFLELPPHFRIIQGDGVNPKSIAAILERLEDEGFSAANLAFGMGGALLQKGIERDTQKFAYKCSAVFDGNYWLDVYKDPVTDPGKKSKRGLLDLVGSYDDGFQTVNIRKAWNSVLSTVYERGPVGRLTTLAEVRKLAALASTVAREDAAPEQAEGLRRADGRRDGLSSDCRSASRDSLDRDLEVFWELYDDAGDARASWLPCPCGKVSCFATTREAHRLLRRQLQSAPQRSPAVSAPCRRVRQHRRPDRCPGLLPPRGQAAGRLRGAGEDVLGHLRHLPHPRLPGVGRHRRAPRLHAGRRRSHGEHGQDRAQ
jgi:nicotinamide phosphoribosyltransferase